MPEPSNQDPPDAKPSREVLEITYGKFAARAAGRFAICLLAATIIFLALLRTFQSYLSVAPPP
ncbi:MAG: hypothetical protein AAF841_11510 [Pseudomonadota bacterium]